MSQVVINARQTEEYQGYDSARCDTCTAFWQAPRPYVPCNTEDMVVTAKLCGVGPAGVNKCHSQYRCSRLNTNTNPNSGPVVCPAIPDQYGTATRTNVRWNPNITRDTSGQWPSRTNTSTSNVQCIYDASRITTAEQINQLQTQFSETPGLGEVIDREILPTFCSLPGTTCRPDPLTGESREVCSRFSSTDQEGAICQAWESRSLQAADAAKRNYCSQRGQETECQCINRSSNPLYQQIGRQTTSQDSCWWEPCRNTGAYLVTSDLLNPVQCPSICQQINNLVADRGGSINIDALRQNIACDLSDPPPVTPEPGGSEVPDPSLPPVEPPVAGGTNWWIWIIIGVVLLVLVGGALLLLLR